MGSQEFHQQAMQLVGAALEVSPHERAAFLDRRCSGNQRLRDEVESLLEFEQETPVVSDKPIISLRQGDSEEPRQVGPYEILRRLGKGGMGDVYLARQERPVRRQVALKLIHSGLHSREIVRRFERERDILAKLQHPNIAHLLDGGADENGRPYLVMEYVDGRPIDKYCDRVRLSIRQRLELFRKVCSAVETAHRDLVAHRDLKPGNILVDAAGEPKLLDFGIAKLLQDEPDGGAAFSTVAGRPPMTPAYASPELMAGEMINTVSDVYSLGVVLYRLLCGRHPYQVRGCSSSEIDRTIRTQDPKRPSTAITSMREPRSSDDRRTPETVSQNRGTDPRRLRRELAGDLDAIVMKALRKEPQERYGSVVELSEDILRYLKGLPVAARADTFRYRSGKFVRRHRFQLATAAVFLVMMIGFVAALWRQVEQVREERDRANKSHDLFVEIIENTDPEDEDEEDVLTPEGVIKRGVDLFGDSFAQAYDIQATVFDSLGRFYKRSGHYEDARQLLEESLRLRREIHGDDHPLVAESRLNMSVLLEKLGENEAAVELSRLGLKQYRQYYKSPHLELARAANNHASQLTLAGRYAEAEALYLESYEMRKALYGDVQLSLTTVLDNLGTLYRKQGDLGKALESYRRALKIREKLLPAKHPDLAKSYSHIGLIFYEQGAYVRAESSYRQALEIRLEKYGDEHPDVAASLYRLALALHKVNRFDEAERLFRRALKMRCGQFGHQSTECANVKSRLAQLLVARGDPEAAQSLAVEALEIFERRNERASAALARIVLGECLAAERRFEEAEETIRKGYSTLCETRGEDDHVTEDARRVLVRFYEAWGRPDKAEEFRG